MNGDIKVINNKTCYEFGYDPKITNLAPGQVMRKSDGSEWIIEDIDRTQCIVWCYQTKSENDHTIEELKKDIINLQNDITYLLPTLRLMDRDITDLYKEYRSINEKLNELIKPEPIEIQLYESIFTKLKLFAVRVYLKLRNLIHS